MTERELIDLGWLPPKKAEELKKLLERTVNSVDNMCGDNRFELIKKYKKELIEATNIKDSPDEMAVIDNVLFRFWQMGWLDKLERLRFVRSQTDG